MVPHQGDKVSVGTSNASVGALCRSFLGQGCADSDTPARCDHYACRGLMSA